MAMIRLSNEQWGFSSNCFACEPTNPEGLAIPFFHDDERAMVVAEFTLSNAFSGAPSYLHGGVVMTILDEIQAWGTIAIAGKFAVTTKTTVEFPRPVRVDKTYTAEAEVTSFGDTSIETVGRILDHQGKVCAAGVSSFYVLSAAVAADAIGEGADVDPSFLQD